jgi:hypothetical protein
LSNSRRDATAAVSAVELTFTNGEEEEEEDDDDDDNDGDDECDNDPFCPSSSTGLNPSLFPLIIDKSNSLFTFSVGLSNTIAG